MINIEFYGIPRERTGTSQTQSAGETLGDILFELGGRYPLFASECLTETGDLRPEFIANVDGDQFARDQAMPIADGSRVLILSADAGG